MKILFLQKVDNALGGVIQVNLNLMNYFLQQGHDVDVVSIRHGDTWDVIEYPKKVNTTVVNEITVWGCPRLNEVFTYVKKLHLLKAISHMVKRIVYKHEIKQDYVRCQQLIREKNVDAIICSHYEILRGIAHEDLHKTFMHFHTSFDQIEKNKSYMTYFNKYNSCIASFVWLSDETKNKAIQAGFKHSVTIYNPIRYSSETTANMDSKKIVFVGRIAEEKRVWLAIQHVREIVREEELKDWVFEIYGDGYETEKLKSSIENDHNIKYMGKTEDVPSVLLSSSLMILTSQFEGMPLSVLEANEYGVPVIAYDFGESCKEVIQDGKTGIVVKQNDYKQFQLELKELMTNEKKRIYLSQNAKKFVKTFSIESIGPQWLTLFQNIKCDAK